MKIIVIYLFVFLSQICFSKTPAQILIEKKAAIRKYQINVIAETLWKESRGEGYNGISSVASVIWCRKHYWKHYANDYATVCLKKKQFSCWNNRAHDATSVAKYCNKKFKPSSINNKVWAFCLKTAESLVDEKFVPVIISDYYHETTIAKPIWAKYLSSVATVNNHKFYASKKVYSLSNEVIN